MNNVIICDIDGTVALMKGKRTPFEYHKAFEDEPNKVVIDVLFATRAYYEEILKEEVGFIFLSARENIKLYGAGKTDSKKFEDVAQLTRAWVFKHIGETCHKFMFREFGDHRKDAFVKFELGKEILKEHNVLCVFDDRNQVVDMWRNGLGLTCFQVADGNF